MKPQWNPWSQWPETEVRHWQAERLGQYLRAVVLPFSAHYRNLFRHHGLTANSIRTLDDLARLPFTTKADLLNTAENPQRFRDFVLVPDEKILSRRPGTIFHMLLNGRKSVREKFESEFRPIFMTFTTGRSAEPVPFLYTQRDLARLAIAGHRVMKICGARHEDRMLNAFPYAPHLAFWLTHYAGTSFGALMFSSGGGKVMGTDDTLRLIRQSKPDNFIGIPTFLYHVLHPAAEEGLRWENLRCLVLGGEKVNDGLRQKLRDLACELGAPKVDVLATYGFTEAKLAWAECPFPHDQPSAGYHLYPDLGIVEIINSRTGEVVPDGQPGEIVFTPLDARGTVVLRYRTGDFIDGGLTYEPCPYCHRTMPRLVGHISRSSEIREMNLDKIKGTLVDFNELEHVLDDVPHVGAWQVELRKVHDDPLELDEIILHVQKTNGADETQLRRELSERCYRRTDIHPNRILFHDAGEMQRLQGVGTLLKEQKLADHRPKIATGKTAIAPP
jgi:phenylacetate-CoA ligase